MSVPIPCVNAGDAEPRTGAGQQRIRWATGNSFLVRALGRGVCSVLYPHRIKVSRALEGLRVIGIVRKYIVSRYGEELKTACEAVRRAGQLCAAIQQEDAAHRVDKSDRSPVTVADLVSQAVVARLLRERFPQDPLVAEEETGVFDGPEGAQLKERVHHYLCRLVENASVEDLLAWIQHGAHGKERGERYWVLDPVDGTKGFLRGEQYAIALALIEGSQVVLGVLGCPNLGAAGVEAVPPGSGVLMYAVRGEGSWMAPISGEGEPVRVRVSDRQPGQTVRICQSVEAAHSAEDLAARVAQAMGCAYESVRMDSQAKYAVVARGDADLYVRVSARGNYREKIWDHAAGALIVEEAGGRVTDAAGKPLDFGAGIRLERNTGICASNGLVHEAALAALRSLRPEPH